MNTCNRKFHKLNIFVACIFIFLPLGYSQHVGHDILNGQREKELPFQNIGGFIVLDLKLGGLVKSKFIFDTGAENIIFFDKSVISLLNLHISQRVKVVGADLLKSKYALVSRKVKFEFENIKSLYRDVLILNEDESHLRSFLGIQVDGIIGGGFFRGLIVEVNYSNNHLIIRDPSHFKPNLKKYEKIPLIVERSKPYLKTEINVAGSPTDSVLMLLDTGAGISALIYEDSDSTLLLNENYIAGELGIGLGGALKGYVGFLKSMHFGTLTVNNKIIAVQSIENRVLRDSLFTKNGLIGNALLSRSNFIIDYVSYNLYFQPHKNFNNKIDYDKSGITLVATGEKLNEYYIKNIRPGSAAEKAQLRIGDKIARIGILPTNLFSLTGLNRKFSKEDGKKYKLTIQRGSRRLKRTLILRDPYKKILHQEIDNS